MEEGRGVYRTLVGRAEGKRPITLRWTLGKEGSIGQTGFGWLRIGSSDGLL